MKKAAILFLALTMIFGLFCAGAASADDAEEAEQAVPELEKSPEWIGQLEQAENAGQLFVVAGIGDTTAYVSMHVKDENGVWKQIMTTPGFIGKFGLGKTREGDGMTPVGTFGFNCAFGIAEDPGCAIPYVQVDEDSYWSGDPREGFCYNEDCIPGLGSAIFLHCMGAARPFTGGCVAIQEAQMRYVMQHVNEDTLVLINTYDKLSGGESWPSSSWPQER